MEVDEVLETTPENQFETKKFWETKRKQRQLRREKLAKHPNFFRFCEIYKDAMLGVANQKVFGDLEDVYYQTHCHLNEQGIDYLEIGEKNWLADVPDDWYDIADDFITEYLDVVWSKIE